MIERVFGFVIANAGSRLLSILPIGYNFAVADLAAHDYIGMLRYYIYNFLGWNPPVSLVGTAVAVDPGGS